MASMDLMYSTTVCVWISKYNKARNKHAVNIVMEKKLYIKQSKSQGFDSCDQPGNLTQIGLKSSIFQPVLPWNLMDGPKKQ